MKKQIVLIIIIFFCSQFAASSQTNKKADLVRVSSLRKIAYNVNYGSSNKFKLNSVILSGFKDSGDNKFYLFHLKDTRSDYELGKELTENTSGFLICTDEAIGKVLLGQKDEWMNQRINVYLEGRDLGLTPLMNVGFVTKIELLDAKGKVIKTIQ